MRDVLSQRLHDLHPAGPSGVLCRIAETAYDPSVWESELDKEKRKAPFSPDKRRKSRHKEKLKALDMDKESALVIRLIEELKFNWLMGE